MEQTLDCLLDCDLLISAPVGEFWLPTEKRKLIDLLLPCLAPYRRSRRTERNYYLYPEGEENQNKQTICWFLQREKLEKIGEKGMPDYLELTEKGMMFLRG